MHDDTIEERLRSALRSEADELPLTVTTDELERRFVLRRRDRTNRRFGLLAAGVAAVAVGTAFAAAFGPFRGPSVAATPQPTVLPSTVLPSPKPTSGPPMRLSVPLGNVGQAVLVRPVGQDPSRPESFEVSLFDPREETSEVLTTIPGSVLPDDGWLDGGEGPPVVSRTGYLAIPFTRGPNEDDRFPAIAIVDLRATRDVWIFDMYRDPEWGPTERLAIRSTNEDRIEIASVVDRTIQPVPAGPGVIVGRWSTDDGARLLATREDAWGYVGDDGTFTAATDLPAVYQRTGRERPAGADAHTLGMGCDSGASGGGCVLGEWTNPAEPPIRSWHTETEGARLAEHSWAADGRGVLLLLVSGMAGDRLVVELVHATTPEARSTLGRVKLPEWVLPAILGISAEPTPGRPTLTAIGDSSGRVFAFVLADGIVRTVDGTAWFAGWADDPAPYDPD